MHIDLLSPKSFAEGQPHAQHRRLREHAPVRMIPDPPPGQGQGARRPCR
jgi:hypothetical protein